MRTRMYFPIIAGAFLMLSCVSTTAQMRGEVVEPSARVAVRMEPDPQAHGNVETRQSRSNETDETLAVDEVDTPVKDMGRMELESKRAAQAPGGGEAFVISQLKILLEEFGEDPEKIPDVFSREVSGYVKVFQENPRYRKFLAASIKRSWEYAPMVTSILKERNLPPALMYLALIESGFNPKAVSRAGAKGLWQFMRKTGKDYSLTISKTNDERTDPEKSTWAATHYFKNLMAIFGDWLLALAAYNAGEGRVIGCLKTINNPFEERSFWHIRDCLAPETRQYPPLIIAAAIIGRNPERYRFPAFSPDDGSYRKVAVAGHPEDGSMARKAGREEVVRETGRVAGMPGKEVAIPAQRGTGKRHKVLYIVQKRNTIDSISEMFRVHGKDVLEWNNLKTEVIRPGQKLRILTEVPYERVTYRVKRNETMSEIARAFSVRPADIVEANGLKNGWSIRTKQLLVFYRAKRRYVIRTVKKGETLSMIARSFSARTDDIIKWNNLDSHLVRPDQKLKINVSSR